MKRAIDFAVAAAALVVLAVPMLVVALSIRAGDGGPALHRQSRVGRRGRIFEMLKFRSMVTNAATIGSYMTTAGDPRITRIGRFIRRTSIDELPQLWNVLVGDMSLVGPRPDVPAQQSSYAPADWTLRHSVRPGLTGLAQATLRSAATPEQRTAADLAYVKTASVGRDLGIILLTVRQVLVRGGN
ncbi:MAG: sugar transferase [Pseudomonadota bacterium]